MNSRIRIIGLIVAISLLLSFTIGCSQETAKSSKQSSAALSFKTSCQKDLEDATQEFRLLETSTGPTTVDGVLVPYNNMLIKIDRSLNLASLYQSVHPDPDMRTVGEDYEQKFSQLITKINLSKPLYDRLSKVSAPEEDAKTNRFLNKELRDFRRAGVDKDQATREKVTKLQEELVVIGQEFAKNIREDVRFILLDSKDELSGLPDDYIEAHKPGDDGKIKITTDYPDYIPFMSYARSDWRRLELYKEYRRRGYPKNEAVLVQLLEKRYQLAKLLGYKDYAHYATEDKMIKTPEAVENFIVKVSEVASGRAEQDYRELLERLRLEKANAQEVGDWQKTYLEELVKREKYEFDSQKVRPYFQYNRVREGLFNITSKMYNVQYNKSDIEVWDESVEAYEVWSGDKMIGRFYLDMHPRKDKFKHAAMGQVVTGISGVQVPEAALMCNFPGGDGSLGLMEHDQVGTFFHEFGHLLHHIFAGDQPWIGI
jgi:thimet oligopeptidase